MDQRGWKSTASYLLLLAGAYVVAVAGSWIFGSPWDNAVYDEMFRRYQPKAWPAEAALLVFDERTLDWMPGGMQGIRKPLAEALRLVAAARPKAVAVDIILSNHTDPAVDSDLAEAFRTTPNLVLSSQLVGDGWEHPLPEFRAAAGVSGHVHAQPDGKDAITRSIPLQEVHGRERLWALSLEAFRLSRRADIIESPSDLQVGGTVIPAAGSRRILRVRFVPPYMKLARVTVKELLENPARASVFTGKVVFAGVTAQTEHDRLFSPYSNGTPTSGIEINADAFETMASGQFITDVDSVAGAAVGAGAGGGLGRGLPLPAGLGGLRGGDPDPGGGIGRALRLFHARARPLVYHLRVGGMVRRHHRSGLLSPGGAPQPAPQRGGAHPLSAGHALRHARDAHAALRHPGVERADLALRPDGGEAQADRAT